MVSCFLVNRIVTHFFEKIILWNLLKNRVTLFCEQQRIQCHIQYSESRIRNGRELTADSDSIDAELAEKARENPREAFEAILRLYQADVRVLMRRHFGNSAEADEVAQEVFVQVYQSLTKFRQDGSLRAWVMAIARNQVLLYFRNETRRRRLTGIVIPPELLEIDATTNDADPFQHETAKAELHALQECLRRLGDDPRALVEAFYFQGTSAESLAAETGKNAGAIRMMLLRIRKQLGKCIRAKLSVGKGGSHE